MNLYCQIVPLILLWVNGCSCLTKPHYGDKIYFSSIQTESRSGPWLDDGWGPPLENYNSEESESRVVFPSDDHGRVLRHQPKSKTPDSKVVFSDDSGAGRKRSFSNDEEYPMEFLDNLLKSPDSKQLQLLFGSDILDEEDGSLLVKSGNSLESPFCQSVPKLNYSTKREDLYGTVRTVVNHGPYVQGIREEKCLNENAPCQFSENMPFGYVVMCRQKYINRNLVALNDDNILEKIAFPFPSGCSCVYKLKNM